MLVATQTGRLLAADAGDLRPAPVIDLSAKVCADRERGLLGVTVDPAFTTNRFIYVYYTFKAFGGCAFNDPKSPVNRISRFVLSNTGVADPRTETVLIDNIPSPEGIHNAGDLHFGKDGLLYASVGDGGCDYERPAICASGSDAARGFNNDAARDRHVLLGKILRIDRNGGIPAGNPFRGTDSARCASEGRTTAGKVCQEIYALGVRNPFRLAFDPDAAGTRFFINDVGQDHWEEIDEGRSGANYGWNVREGHCTVNSAQACPSLPAGLTDPLFDYHHRTGCTAVTAGAFVPNGIWPAAYADDYLYGDFTCGKIFRLSLAGGTPSTSEFVTGFGSNSITGMTFGPHGSTRALFYMTYLGGGQVRRISHVGSGNREPTATAAAAPTAGPLPLTVSFDARASGDPDGDPLSYSWELGDGTVRTGAVVTHTYVTASVYTARLTVRDGRGGQAVDTVQIHAGNRPPELTISKPARSDRFGVGQTIVLVGNATDPEDGRLRASRLTWTVALRHADHEHPFLSSTAGNRIRFEAPPPESLAAAATSRLIIRLKATDSQGLSSLVSRRLEPNRVRLVLVSRPRGLPLVANGLRSRAPLRLASWEGYGIGVRAPWRAADPERRWWRFRSWSNGRPRVHTVETPGKRTKLTATFVRPRG